MPSHTKSPKKIARRPGIVRRSFALPAKLIEQVSEAAPPPYGANVNAAVRHALEQFVERRRREEFELRMDEMAKDPWIRQVNAEIFRELEGSPDEALPPP
jgi:hypothetical protein